MSLLLNEEPVGWAITRGTSGGESKFIPMTPTDLMMRISAGRAMMNYVAVSGRYDLFEGVNLNLNFPSVVGTVRVGEREVEYGYSSGIYTKHVSAFTPIRSEPSQGEIDKLGGGKTIRDWEARFELAYQKCKDENVTLEGENRVPTAAVGVSILFCDIRGFTARSEQSTPEEMVTLLNEYLPGAVEPARRHEGTVNKFGGDSARVIYGAPRRLQESAYQAVLTALEMRANLKRLNERLVERGEAPLRVGVGINTGVVLAGAVGSKERQEYAPTLVVDVIGDTVNLASRIESLNKVYPEHDILISGQTHDALGSRRREFEFADLGEVQIRGKVKSVRVWAVKARNTD